jgi:N,N-dimethylformamidase beta subunit-like, C-terminal
MCGAGRDMVVADLRDTLHGCETVRLPATSEPPPQPPPVVLENQRPGTPGWAEFALAPEGAIEGYTQPSVAPGETLSFHVSTEPEAQYRILVYRAGYYGGIGARLVACLPSCDGTAQAQALEAPTPGTGGLVHAGWPASQLLEAPAEWVSGYYFARFALTSGPFAGMATTTWFLVREAVGDRRAPILVQASPNTWQAYNGWGGGSLYEFNSPAGRRAVKVAFDRPYDQPVEQPLIWELPLARFLERSEYDVAYQADVDTARDPGSFEGRRIVVVSGHSEYWTKGMRDTFEHARDSGVDLAFFGANAAYWQIRYEEDFRTIAGYKSSAGDPETDPALETDLFRILVPPRYECALMGVQHQGGELDWTTDGDYVVTEAARTDAWLSGAGFTPGDVLPGIVSREVDTIPSSQTAEDCCGHRVTVLFHRELGGDTLGDADAVRYDAASGARVFASGSHQFVWGLEDVPEVERMRHGLADGRLQAFVRRMLDDMLAGG